MGRSKGCTARSRRQLLRSDRAQYLENQFDLPWPLYFGNFSAALRGGTFFLWFKNSAVLTLGSVILCTLCAALAAFAVARMRFRRPALLHPGADGGRTERMR